jgi:hypothetical protein
MSFASASQPAPGKKIALASACGEAQSSPAARPGCTAMAENAEFPRYWANDRCYFHGRRPKRALLITSDFSRWGLSCRRPTAVWRSLPCQRRPKSRYFYAFRCFPRSRPHGRGSKNGSEGPSYAADFLKEIWSGRRDSNPRRQPWQGWE